MTHSDPIGDLLIRIKNAYLASHRQVKIPYSKVKEQIVKVLESEGYIGKILVKQEDNKKMLKIKLLYKDGKPVMKEIKRVSKPGLRLYFGKGQLPKVLSGYGKTIITTSKGIMTGEEARKKGLGGELICKVW